MWPFYPSYSCSIPQFLPMRSSCILYFSTRNYTPTHQQVTLSLSRRRKVSFSSPRGSQSSSIHAVAVHIQLQKYKTNCQSRPTNWANVLLISIFFHTYLGRLPDTFTRPSHKHNTFLFYSHWRTIDVRPFYIPIGFESALHQRLVKVWNGVPGSSKRVNGE